MWISRFRFCWKVVGGVVIVRGFGKFRRTMSEVFLSSSFFGVGVWFFRIRVYSL